MCATNVLAIYLCFSLPVAATAPQGLPETFDHYHPAKLNQAAIERLQTGDSATARILLERAALLAPHEPSIAGNLAELRAYRNEPAIIVSPQPAEKPVSGETPATAATDAMEALPALWSPM